MDLGPYELAGAAVAVLLFREAASLVKWTVDKIQARHRPPPPDLSDILARLTTCLEQLAPRVEKIEEIAVDYAERGVCPWTSVSGQRDVLGAIKEKLST